MLSSEQRLYTWIDVEDVFLKLKQDNAWPEWLKTVRAYWDGLTLEVAGVDNNAASDKLNDSNQDLNGCRMLLRLLEELSWSLAVRNAIASVH